MRALEIIRTALEAVRNNRLRSLLTIVGIGIGIASVVLTVGLGAGVSATVTEQINGLGSNLLVVSPGSSTTNGVRQGRGSATTLTLADAQALQQPGVAPDVAAVAPVTTSSTTVYAGEISWTTSVVATTPSWQDVRGRTLAAGRFLTDNDDAQANLVTVLGSDTAEELFGSTVQAVGQEVRIGSVGFTVVGVLEASGSSSGTDDDQAIVPLSTGSRVLGMSTTLSSIYLSATSSDRLSAAYTETLTALATLHGLAPDAADVTVTSQESLLDAVSTTTQAFTALLGGIASISLLVGGIGVMNIMLVSVTERTREIGLRKALGATPSAIRRQFLTEAAVLGLGGGVGGLAVGTLGIVVLPGLIGQALVLSPTAVGAALTVAVGVGLVAGVYPASRAAQLAPIDALRHE